MSHVNLDLLTVNQLKDIIIHQGKQLRFSEIQKNSLKTQLEKSEDDYEILGDKLLEVRSILNV